MKELPLEISQEPNRCIIKIMGEVPNTLAEQFEQALMRAGEQHPKLAIFDLSGMPNISSKVMGALATFHRVVKAGGGRVAIAAARPLVRIALERARLHALFQLADTVAAALAPPPSRLPN